jgi:hypothetical protein
LFTLSIAKIVPKKHAGEIRFQHASNLTFFIYEYLFDLLLLFSSYLNEGPEDDFDEEYDLSFLLLTEVFVYFYAIF